LEVAEVIAGERVVTLQYADNQEDRRVRVYPDTLNAIAFTYRMESFATVLFEGFPDGAVIFSSGREMGTIAAGRYTARNLLPGPRSFSVYLDSWKEPYTIDVELSARKPNDPITFQGGRILALSVPRGVRIAVDGRQVAVGTGGREPCDLGVFYAGSHTVEFSGDTWITQSMPALVRPGTDTRISAALVTKPAPTSVEAGAATPGAHDGPGILRATDNSGLAENLEARLRRDGEDTPLLFGWDQALSLPAGRYVMEARRKGDPDWAFSSPFDIVSGGELTFSVPPVGYSAAWKIADLELKRQAAVLALDRAVRAKRARTITSNISLWTGLASLVPVVYGMVDGFIVYPTYQAETDFDVAAALHDRLMLDQNLWFFGSIAAGASAVSWSVRFFWNKSLPRALEALDAIDEELDYLRSPQ
ncbi:MAG: hypothetical protein JXM71_11135, partial [Spirochaetales bacterium]|nr:hypothetical protein [Spirochaetales bacterium]